MSSDDDSSDIMNLSDNDEHDNELFRELYQTYWPCPGGFRSFEDRLKWWDRVDRFDQWYFKEHGLKWEDAYGPGETSTASANADMAGTSSSGGASKEVVPPTEGDQDTTMDKGSQKSQKGKKNTSPAKAAGKKATAGKQQTEKRSLPPRKAAMKTGEANVDEDDEDEAPIAESAEAASERPTIAARGPGERVWLPRSINDFGGRRSQFTAQEHGKFVAMLLNLQNFGRLRFSDNGNVYKKMSHDLRKENETFNDYVANTTKKSIVVANNVLPKPVRDYVKEWMDRKKKALSAISSRYIKKGISYVTMPQKDYPALKFEKHLLDVGTAPYLKKPLMTRKNTIPMENPPPQQINSDGKSALIYHDPNIKLLCSKFGPEVACSSSALRCLLLWRGPKLTGECDLPVVIKGEYHEGRRVKVLCISKPLPPRTLSKRQMMSVRAKSAVMETLVGLPSENPVDFGTYDPDAAEVDPSAPSTSWANISIDSAGARGDSMRDEMSSVTGLDADSSMDDDDGSVTDTEFRGRNRPLLRSQGRALTDTEDFDHDSSFRNSSSSVRPRSKSVSKRLDARSTMSPPVSSSPRRTSRNGAGDVVGEIMSSMVQPTKKAVKFHSLMGDARKRGESAAIEDSRDYVPPGKPNCMRQYLLFSLKDFNIVVRSNVHGLVAKSGDCGRDPDARASVSSKVEYQPSFGAEERTTEEVVDEYLTVLLKSSDVHFRTRVKYEPDYDILGFDELAREFHFKDYPKGIPETQAIVQGMRRLHIVLTELRNLPEEKTFLLRFNAGDEKSFSIFEAIGTKDAEDGFEVSNDSVLDLYKVYDSCNFLRVPNVSTFDECFRPIDNEVVLQWHRVAKRIPASFPPRKGNELAMFDVGKPKKKRGRKRKSGSSKRGRPRRIESQKGEASDGDSMTDVN